MMYLLKKIILFFCCAIIFISKISAQADSSNAMHIAVAAPLYLDSAFDNTGYKLQGNSIPQYILTGLDFYNGIMLAIDSLKKENINAQVFVYDTKATNIDSAFNDMKQQRVSLIIASFNNTAEQKTFSDFSFSNNIPLISSTYPNDAGIAGNPYFIMLNSSLQTHVQAIYNYAKKNYSKNKVLFVTKNGFLESKIKAFFAADNQASNPLQYRLLELSDNFTIDNISPLLDSSKQNIIICGSLNESFATAFYQTVNNAKTYKTVIIGMPDWDAMKELNKPQTNTNTSIIYSTPFNFLRNDSLLKMIAVSYKNKIGGKPSDMVYKGFETMYHFTHLLKMYDHDFLNHLSAKDFSAFDNFSIQPVKIKPTSFIPDYLENKNLYFVKKINGTVVSVSELK